MQGLETRSLNEQIKRNMKRFPDVFILKFSEQEFQYQKSQFAISNSINMGMKFLKLQNETSKKCN